MFEHGKINYRQLVQLIFISRIIIAITYLPVLSSPPGNQDIWISILLSFPIQLLLSIPIYLLWRRFPNQTIIQYSQSIIGRSGKIIGILYIWFFIHFAVITLSYFNLFLTTAIMPETPLLFFSILLVGFCAYAVGAGLEVLGRMAEIVAPIIILAIITIIVLTAKDMDLKNLTPVFESGLWPVLGGGLTASARTFETTALAMVLPSLNDNKKAKRVFIMGFLIITIFFETIGLSALTILGSELAKNHAFPFYAVVRTIKIADFIERIEAIHMGIWVLGAFIKISFWFYLAVLGMGQLFNLKDYTPLILPTGTIIVPLSILMASSLVELIEFTDYRVFTWYALIFILFIPSILLFIAIVKKKGGNKNES